MYKGSRLGRILKLWRPKGSWSVFKALKEKKSKLRMLYLSNVKSE